MRPPERVRLGTALGLLGRRVGLTNDDVAAIGHGRDRADAGKLK